MKILYQSFDGTIFEDETECYCHEMKQEHSHLKNIVFFNAENQEYKIEDDLFDDDIYQKAEKVIIHNGNELADFVWLIDETGWTEFYQITEVGTWIRKESSWNGRWTKV